MKNIIFTEILEDENNPLNSWKQLLEQEKVNFTTVTTEYTKLIITNDFRKNKEDILNFVKSGGVCIVQKPENIEEIGIYKEEEILVTSISFPEYAISNACYPNIAFAYKGSYQPEDTVGYYRLLEERITKTDVLNSMKPIFIRKTYGQGVFYICTVDFSNFLNLNGNTLRSIKSRFSSTDVTERISQIDKDLISFSMIQLVKSIYKEQNMPWIDFCYFPEKSKAVFLMRIDVDGSDSSTIKKISDLGVKYGVPTTFYLNKSFINSTGVTIKEINQIDHFHDLANHGVVHNIYDSYEDNVANIKECEDWIKEKFGVKTTGFVAPRGIWNNSLEQALVSLNYDYSSDFGFVMHGLPYRPYMNNEKSKLLQVPVNAYNVGRAEIYYTGKIDYLSDEMILNYYFSYFNDVMSEKGSGLIHIFGHPHGLGKRPELLESIYKYIKTNDILAISIREFVDWWKYREESNYELNFEKGKYVVEFTNNPLNYSMSLND